MKKNLWIIFAAAISTSLLAQDATNSTPVLQAPPPPETAPATTQTMPPVENTPPPATPAVAPTAEAPTNAPAAPRKKATKKKKAAKTTKKAAARKHAAPAPELKTVPLVAGPAVVAANHVNVRSKAGLVGEIVTRMTNGQPVTVVEEIHLKKSGPEEPSAWAKILLPPDTHVWVKSSYLDTANTVTSKKLNLRAGPGENYGVVGTLQKGDAVQTIEAKGDWTEIQAPTNAYAFMAAQYLKQGEEEMPTVAANNNAETMPAPTPETMTNSETTMAPPPTTEMPSLTDTNATAMNTTPTPEMQPTPATPENAQPAQEEQPPRIVEHEGIVRSSFSVQAPTRYELVSPDTKEVVDFLYTPTTNLDLSRYKGLHIIVTGEEGLDERWKNTPVITIQRIQVLD